MTLITPSIGLARLGLTILRLVVGSPALAAEGVQFFDDNGLSFEAPQPEEANPAPAAPTDAQDTPPAPASPAPRRGAKPIPEAVEADTEAGEEPEEEDADPEPEGPKMKALRTPLTSLPSGLGTVQVAGLRAVTDEERAEMKGHLRCADPLAVELELKGRVRSVVATAMQVPADKLPDRLTWIVGRKGRCFERPAGQVSFELDLLDETVRRLVLSGGGR